MTRSWSDKFWFLIILVEVLFLAILGYADSGRSRSVQAQSQIPFEVYESGGFCVFHVLYPHGEGLAVASRATAAPGVLLSCQ